MRRTTGIWILLVGIVALLLGTPSAYRGVTALSRRADGDSRVRKARLNKGTTVHRLVTNAGLEYPPRSLYIRAFKRERQMELWASSSASTPHKLIQTYEIAAMSGVLGPKRREGDYQVPEGFYTIDRFNPKSSYHLSLGLDYPNKSDRLLSDKRRPGSDIFIHGNRVSIGCMAMTDDRIEEIYVLALDARSSGQRRIPVHVFPCRLSERNLAKIKREYPSKWLHLFWGSLKPAYDQFEKSRLVPTAKVLASGRYVVGP